MSLGHIVQADPVGKAFIQFVNGFELGFQVHASRNEGWQRKTIRGADGGFPSSKIPEVRCYETKSEWGAEAAGKSYQSQGIKPPKNARMGGSK